MEAQKQKLTPEDIIAAHNAGEDVARIFASLPREEAVALRTELALRQKEAHQAVWRAKQNVRRVEAEIGNAEIDKSRASQLVKTFGQQLYNVFEAAYKDPQSAARKCWEYEQQYSAKDAEKVLKTAPDTFGELKGACVLGLAIGQRRDALNTLRGLEYCKLRDYFSRSEAAYKKLQRALAS